MKLIWKTIDSPNGEEFVSVVSQLLSDSFYSRTLWIILASTANFTDSYLKF